jgi:hypothetical protein
MPVGHRNALDDVGPSLADTGLAGPVRIGGSVVALVHSTRVKL